MDQRKNNLTRSGIVPDNTNESYVINTTQMAAFIQKQLDTVIAATNRNLAEGVERFPDIRIKAYNYQLGTHFYPLVIFIPQEAVYKKAKKNVPSKNGMTKDGRISIRADVNAQSEDYGGGVRLHSVVYETINHFMYPNGGKAFRCRNVQEQNGIVRRDVDKILSLCKLSRCKMRNGKGTVMVALDLYHVLHDMLVKPDDNRKFHVLIHKAKRMKDGSYRFYLTRSVVTDKGKKGSDIDSEYKALQRQMSSGGGLV